MTDQERVKILTEFLQMFPKAWGNDGREFDGGSSVIWSGEGAELNDGTDCFDYNAWEWDRKEEHYIMGVSKPMVEFADKHGCFWECYDAGTYLLQEN